MTINKDKLITRQKLFSILTNIIDTSDVFCMSKTTTDKSVVTPNNIILMDSNENEYINNSNNNININNLQDDDELQLVVKFSNTDIDDAHAWVEKLIIQLKLENNCEIIDEGDFDENSIIAIFILDDFINDSNNINNLTNDNNIESMLITNDTLIEYNDDNDINTDNDVNNLISQIEILNQDTINNKNEINFNNDSDNETNNTNENKIDIDIAENNQININQEDIANVISNNDDNSINDNSIDEDNNRDNDEKSIINIVSNNNDSIVTDNTITDNTITDSIITDNIIVADNNNVKESGVFINKNNKSLSALDILNNIDPLTGQLRYSSICNNSFIDNEENNINNINEENINDEEKVQVINVTEVTENLNKQKLKSTKQINPAIVATQKTKTNLQVNINSIKNNPPSQGISLRGISNRVSATTTDGRIMSAAAQVREMLDEIISKNTMTINILPLLQDVANCKKEMRLTYPLLMKVNPNLGFKDQASFGGKKRYSKKTVQYCNQEFYITNHIFVQNVSKIRSYLESLNLIDKKENTSTTEIVDKQKIIQDLINQKVNATGKSIPDTIKVDNIAINDTKTEIKV